MSGHRIAVGLGAFCLLGGWGAGFLLLRAALIARSRFFPVEVPAPAVIRTDPTLIRPLPKDLDALFWASRSLSKPQVAGLRARLAQDPGDTRTRALLLDHAWFDFMAPGMNALHDEELVWFVANVPASPILATKQAAILPRGNEPTADLLERLFNRAITRSPGDAAIRANAVHVLRHS